MTIPWMRSGYELGDPEDKQTMTTGGIVALGPIANNIEQMLCNRTDTLQARPGRHRWELLDGDGVTVGQLSRDFQPPAGMRCAAAAVLAVARWDREHSEAQYRDGYLCDAWEVVVPELVFEPA